MRIQGRCSNRALQGCGQEGGAPGFRGLLFPFLHRARRFFSFSKKRKKRMGAQKSGRPMVAPTFIDGSAMEIVETGGQSRPPLHSKTMVRCRITRVGL